MGAAWTLLLGKHSGHAAWKFHTAGCTPGLVKLCMKGCINELMLWLHLGQHRPNSWCGENASVAPLQEAVLGPYLRHDAVHIGIHQDHCLQSLTPVMEGPLA